MDMPAGNWLHLPHSGGVYEQDDILMTLAELARRTWYVFGYKPTNKMKWNSYDRDFIAWVNEAADGAK